MNRGIYHATPLALTDGQQIEHFQTDSAGSLKTSNAGSATPPTVPTTSSYTSANISVSSSGDNTGVAAVAAQTVRVYGIALTFASPVDASLKDGAGTTLGVFQGVTSLVLDPFPSGSPRFITSSGNAFIINLSAAVACKGTLWYTQS